jgi:membrane-associated phospholipid phosphatase
MRIRAIIWVIGWVGVGIAIAAASSWAASPPQAEQQDVTEKQSSSKPEKRQMKQPKPIAGIEDQEPIPTAQHGWKALGNDFLQDQVQIWTSPAKIRVSDAQWLVPLSGITAGLFVTDSTYNAHLSHSPSTISRYTNLSNASVGALIGAAGGMWLLSHATHNAHWRETGFLAGEAALNSLAVVEALKYPMGRERPLQGNGSGNFFQGGTSFPSEHAAAAWSVAGVIAHEYPGLLTKVIVYGLAATVSYSRVHGQQHFPSDVFVGTVIGNLVAQNVYSRHHDPELGGEAWRSISQVFRGDGSLSPANIGSPYVPLDSWVYPVFDRLIALGYLDLGFVGQRPWTRLECAHSVLEVSDKLTDSGPNSNGSYTSLRDLENEFAPELAELGGGPTGQFRLESVYSRVTNIDGQPLADSYHFGQTLINDYGRPYQEGFNNVTGFSTYATEGRFSIYVRGEYQHAPSAPAYSQAVRQVIANIDLNPLQPPAPVSGINQFDLLDAYVGVNLENWELTFGKQSLWWGPGYGGAFLFSNNADSNYMFRASRVTPFTLPWILRKIGPVKMDFFFGKLSGNSFPPRPFIHGEKISFKPTANLEFGFSRTSEFAGVGRPMTLGAVWESFVSYVSSVGYPAYKNPGKRTGGFEFSYKVPFVRDWLTIYLDALSPDDPNPIASPRRAAVNPGLYMPKIPGLPKLDFRFEAVYTNTPTRDPSYLNQGGQYIYWEQFYHDLYTTNKNIIGNWIGRDGQGFQSWSKYWFSPRNTLEFGYRHAKVNANFIPGGETLNDASVKLDWLVRRNLSISAFVQYEQWKAPLLAPTSQTNWTSSVEVSFQPQKLFRRSTTDALGEAGSTAPNGAQP